MEMIFVTPPMMIIDQPLIEQYAVLPRRD